jgi:hypothetical protein
VNVREGRAPGDPWLVRRNFHGSLVEVSANSGDLVYITSEEGGFSQYVEPSGIQLARVLYRCSGASAAPGREATGSPFSGNTRQLDDNLPVRLDHSSHGYGRRAGVPACAPHECVSTMVQR